MASIDLSRAMRRARLGYERGRALRALAVVSPVLFVVAVAVLLSSRPLSALVFGGSLFVLGAGLLWYGRTVRKAVLPGFMAGLVPLSLALCANQMGHACVGGQCTSLCLPACLLGGLVAGLSVAFVGHRGRHGAGFWVACSGVALLTGAMGCTCIGYAGLAGLAGGFGVGLVPALWPRRGDTVG